MGSKRTNKANAALRRQAEKKLPIDITERKQAEKALQESEYFFKESQRAGFIGSYEADFVKGVWESSEVLDQLFGIDEHYPRSIQGWLEIVHPEDRKMMNEYLTEEMISKRKDFDKEYRIIRQSDGETRWVNGQGKVSFDSKGTALSLIGTIQDITDRKRVEHDLINANQFITNILASITDAFFALDHNLICTFFNPAAEQLLSRRSEDVLGKNLFDAFPEARGSIFEINYRQAIAEKKAMNFEVFFDVDPYRHWYDVRVYPQNNGISVYFQVSTQRKEYEKVLIQAKEAAEEANRTKNLFLAKMSHEMRTPMNSIIGMTDLTLLTELGEQQRNYLSYVKKSAQSLLEIISDVLDIAKIEAGQFDLIMEKFNLRDLIVEKEVVFNVLRGEKPLAFHYVIDSQIPEMMMGDPLRLNQIILNLLSNAVKFTVSGTIKLGVELIHCSQEKLILKFCMEDSGIGIESVHLTRIFGSFIQADDSITRRHGGTGLGLAISKTLVEKMGGEINVESEPGSGSRFYFTAVFKSEVDPHHQQY